MGKRYKLRLQEFFQTRKSTTLSFLTGSGLEFHYTQEFSSLSIIPFHLLLKLLKYALFFSFCLLHFFASRFLPHRGNIPLQDVKNEPLSTILFSPRIVESQPRNLARCKVLTISAEELFLLRMTAEPFHYNPFVTIALLSPNIKTLILRPFQL